MTNSPRATGSNRRRARYVIAISFTVISLLGAVGPGIPTLVHREIPPYNAMLAITTATLIAVIWYTAFTYDSLTTARDSLEFERERDSQERKAKRPPLASGALSELRWLDHTLRGVAEARGAPPADASLVHPMLTSVIAQASLFSTSTVAILADFLAVLDRIEIELAAFDAVAASTRSKQSQSASTWSDAMRTRSEAKYALGRLPDLVRQLQTEGGVMPPALHLAQIPDPPPSPFEG